MKRKAIEDAGSQRPKRVVKSLAEKARLQRLRDTACRRVASAPVRLADAEAGAGRHASEEARQVQAKQVKAAKQAAKFDREVATAAAAVDRELSCAARQPAAAITKAAKVIARQQKRRSKHPLLNIARQGVHFQAHHVSGLDINKDHRHQLDRMKEECPYCKALTWLGERVNACVNSCLPQCWMQQLYAICYMRCRLHDPVLCYMLYGRCTICMLLGTHHVQQSCPL